ncbi:hypothetical protein HBB16_01350 [Pseudonocardia sp. MCCB 268]|nr:hypothetical protein [Pseudonocardia cytotoxica]
MRRQASARGHRPGRRRYRRRHGSGRDADPVLAGDVQAASAGGPGRQGGGRGAVRRRADHDLLDEFDQDWVVDRPPRHAQRAPADDPPEDTGGDRWSWTRPACRCVESSWACCSRPWSSRSGGDAARLRGPARGAPGGAHGRGGGRQHDPDRLAGDGPGTGLLQKTPPEPDRQDAELVGSLDRPSALHGEAGSVTRESATPAWSANYDLGCAASGC